MRRSYLYWFLTLALLILVPGSVMAQGESPADTTLSRQLAGQRALRTGDRGPAVAALQQMLQERGFDPVLVDGIFGPLTERAVRQAQGALGLTQDGLAGVQTTAALEARVAAAPMAVTADLFTTADEPRIPTATLVLHAADGTEQGSEGEPFALTFNGAPDPALLPTILDTLRAHEMKATFFVTAAAAESAPELVAQIAAAGHEVGLGGLSPAPMAGLSEQEMREQLARAAKAVSGAAEKAVTQFRPPQGAGSDTLVKVAGELGLQTTLWTNVGVTDHPGRTPTDLAEGLAAAAYPGSVLMIHQDRPGTVDALEPLLELIAARGLLSVSLSDLGRF
ncbi:MAG: polysaccharide deacetylase [Symbiobacteriaceae bacterium]|jgi:peptidoglycan/xylan/chitin deacetylase (PgdA/CDA1 family)|nr:polysaccharide deacetylase [Symbiobacteriaceae bacterium]